MCNTLKRMAAKFVLGSLFALLLVLLVSADGTAMDRSELAKVLNIMPPNGPFWKYGNVVMRARSRKAGLAPVVFSHWSHRSRYTCRVCHQELGFSMRKGDTGITRPQYLAGKFCGACHNGTIAFTVKDGPQAQCKKCHMDTTKDLEQKFSDFANSLPMAPFGNGIDWSAALKDGAVKPANTFDSSFVAIPFPEKLRQPIKLGTASPRSDVSFSHEDHFAELDCSSCHPDIFNIKKKTTADFSMDSNIFGNFCGACHMQVAFPMNDCRRCHLSMGNSTF
jgi:c(7)-type cytochrome triheme protein